MAVDPKAEIQAALKKAVEKEAPGHAVERIYTLERPRQASHGDYSSSAALQLAKLLKRNPRDLARSLSDSTVALTPGLAALIEPPSIEGPGFINFRLKTGSKVDVIRRALEAGKAYGRVRKDQPVSVQVEFVSANPTGPLHVGHGRQAALGDALAALMEAQGDKVTREFYYNDAGAQIQNLALSVQARKRGLKPGDAGWPKDGYAGEYIGEIAAAYRGPDELDAIRVFAVAYLRNEQDIDLREFGVKFDVYYLESSLYADGKVEAVVKGLTESGKTYDKDGALWLRTTDFGDDKDRVMRKSREKGGEYTYFVPDIAYHLGKWQRGFQRAINIQGADHHSTVTRVRAGLQALEVGIPAGYPEYVLHQIVTVMKGGEEVKISKRAGSYVTVRDLIDEVGRDAVRYFFLMRKGDSQLVFDVDLARAQSEENPVYYIQMAHARMSGIFRVGEVDAHTITGEGADLSLLELP